MYVYIYIYVLCSVVSDSLRPHGLQPTRLLCPWRLSKQEYWSGLQCLPPENLPNPGIELRSPVLQADFLLSAPPGTSKNTGVGSLSLHGGLPDPEIELGSPALQADSLPAELLGKPRTHHTHTIFSYIPMMKLNL